MKRSTFLLITALLSFAFGAMMFFLPAAAANFLGIATSPATTSVLRGMGGLIIGTGTMNFLIYNNNNPATIMMVLLTNIITHILGISADVLGIMSGALLPIKMAPVEIVHLFIGIGSWICLLRFKPEPK
ncbi:MAG TPA: hypothetical protein VK718_08375 [Ferruginibacter sp.]|jgi:hypothetical protein|nr:hypothetical protein [Ferruginibacter sp.]